MAVKPCRVHLTGAAGYDDTVFSGCCLSGHEAWLANLDCPVLRLDSGAPVEDLVTQILAA